MLAIDVVLLSIDVCSYLCECAIDVCFLLLLVHYQWTPLYAIDVLLFYVLWMCTLCTSMYMTCSMDVLLQHMYVQIFLSFPMLYGCTQSVHLCIIFFFFNNQNTYTLILSKRCSHYTQKTINITSCCMIEYIISFKVNIFNQT